MKTPPPRVRLTMPTRAVMDLLMSSTLEDPPWGYRICEHTGLGPGTVYPILERLEEVCWIAGSWEPGLPADRPRRRTYQVTGAGRNQYLNALEARKGRRLKSWLRPEGGAA